MKKRQWVIFGAVIVVCAAAFLFLKLGFPLNTSFGEIFTNQNVEKIVIVDGNSGKSKQTTDATQISRFLESVSKEKLHRSFDISGKSGWSYRVEFYLKGQDGYYEYLVNSYFIKRDGFSASLPTGNCREEDTQRVVKTIGDFYTALS